MDLLLATSNRHKTREFAELLGAKFRVSDLHGRGDVPSIVESGQTFAENAAIKALTVSRLFPNEIVLADDSGLEVQTLGGAPGILSARYAGPHATEAQNVVRLLKEMRSHVRREARFCCALVVAQNGISLGQFDGEVRGQIASAAHGGNGFGYDSVFVPNELSVTFAEMSPAAKNRISHRAKAVADLTGFLKHG